MASKRVAQKVTKSASCLCNSINFTLTGVDKGAVLCHCSNCQKASGSAFAHNYRFTQAEITFSKGESLVKQYVDSATKSGNSLHRHFCSNCGSNLFLTNPKPFPGLVILPTGAIQDRTQPSFELFGENRHDWVGNLTSKPANL